MDKKFDVVALGELLIDFTENGVSGQGNPILEANPGGAPCNVLAMLQNLGSKTSFIGKVGNDQFGRMLKETIESVGIDSGNLIMDDEVHTTLAFVHTFEDGDRDFSFYRNPGADMMLKVTDVQKDRIEASKIFHFGTLSLPGSVTVLYFLPNLLISSTNSALSPSRVNPNVTRQSSHTDMLPG